MIAQQCIYKYFIYRLSLMLLNLYETNLHKGYKTEKLFLVSLDIIQNIIKIT